MIRALLILFFCLNMATLLLANNAQLSIRNIEGNSVEFQVSWENSWFYHDSIVPYNHDALWIFFKGKHLDSDNWQHINIQEDGNHEVVSGVASVKSSRNNTGILVSRTLFGEGEMNLALKVELQSLELQRHYSEISVFAFEMVYVAEESFYVGDSSSNNSLINYSNKSAFEIGSEDAISVGEIEEGLTSNADFPPSGEIPSSYPKGYAGFYCMKYEISQQQYADFLNTLTSDQRSNRKINKQIETLCFSEEDHIGGERNFITQSNGNYGCDANQNGILGEYDDGNSIACNFLSWAHLTAYLDWAGLRPMTELEFEKASRGPVYPKALEFAWGNGNVVNTKYANLTADEIESVLDTIPENFGIANFGYCLPSGPLRCGFAAGSNTSRIESGASYYGIMELSGNLWELCINLNDEGLKFEGQHGDGNLDVDGFSDISSWDGIEGMASGHRGGGWNSGILAGFRDLAVSDRFYAYLNGNDLERGTVGGRGVISMSLFD